jgi:DNA-binding NarL/FixJ family response regulator
MKITKISLAIVDDHQIVIDGLKSLLQGYDQFKVVLECTELSKAVHHKFPEIKILALSMSGQGELVNSMINDADISGYVLKNIGKKELMDALEKISAGGIYFSDEVLLEMTKASELKKESDDAHLTAREIEIIKLIEKEFNNKQIAETLFLSERTVETHRKNVFRKTKTSGVIGLIKFAYEHKLI